MESSASTVSRGLLVILRVYLGTVLFVAGFGKVTSGWNGTRLEGALQGLGPNAHGFFQPFLDAVVVPASDVFAALVAYGEVLAGLGLLLGLLTRPAGIAAMLMTLNYMLLKGHWFWTPASNDAALFVIALVVVLGAAGRTLGVDRFLHRRYPDTPLW